MKQKTISEAGESQSIKDLAVRLIFILCFPSFVTRGLIILTGRCKLYSARYSKNPNTILSSTAMMGLGSVWSLVLEHAGAIKGDYDIMGGDEVRVSEHK